MEPTKELVPTPPTIPATADKSCPPDTVKSAGERRDEYVSHALDAAYAKASELKLTKEETTSLTAPFPDEAVYEGAGGDSTLLYITHAYIEERLNAILGLGQWSLIPRQSRQERGIKKDKYGNDIVTVFVDCVLVVRGCFVGEDWAEMDYIPANAKMGYSDAFSGAQSNALRRICGKRLGIGSQVWKRDWCEGWKNRKRGNPPSQPQPTPPASAPTTPQPATDEKLSATGMVVNIEQLPLPKKPGSFRYKIMIGNQPRPFYTFDKKIHDLCHDKAMDGPVTITYHVGKYGQDIDTATFEPPLEKYNGELEGK